MQLYPAVIIGGPPNSGKSVLTYNLSQRLRQQGILHYVLRANPDGEGDWANEADQALVRHILAPRRWSQPFVEHICRSLDQRHLPLLVDIGGRPQTWQEVIFDHCTHIVLLTPDAASQADWQARAGRHNLRLLADLRSELHGLNSVSSTNPILTGVLAGLAWGQTVGGPTFEALVERAAHLLRYDPDQLRRSHLTSAPVELTVDLDRLARSLDTPHEGEQALWRPDQLPGLLEYLPAGKPMGLYGRAPNWLYAAVALHAQPAPFYQFDVRLGWVAPPELVLGQPAPDTVLQCRPESLANRVELTFTMSATHLDYDEVRRLTVPVPPPNKALVLSGKIPLWLITALVIAYQDAPLLAVYQPQVGRVVVRSRLADIAPGDLLPPVESPGVKTPG
jgi:CRISPR-associated protein Csx3